MIKLANLWPSRDQKAWEDALDRYCEFVKPPNMSLEKSLDALDLGRIEGFGLAPVSWTVESLGSGYLV
jgi:hypothetical protein